MKKTTHKTKKLAVTFSERDATALQRYASRAGVTKAIAVKRIVRQYLRSCEALSDDEVAKNQLGLFDSVQIDIFNNITK